MTQDKNVMSSIESKLDSLLEAKVEAKKSMLDLVSEVKEVIHRISVLEKFDIKRVDRLENYFDMLKDRLLIIESKGPPIMSEIVTKQIEFTSSMVDLKSKMEHISKNLDQKNVRWENIVLTLLTALGTIISSIILFKLGVK